MQITHCKQCRKEISYPDETCSDEAPEFCSSACSKRNFRENELFERDMLEAGAARDEELFF